MCQTCSGQACSLHSLHGARPSTRWSSRITILTPENVIVGDGRRPVLIGSGSCQAFGKRMLTQGTDGIARRFDGVSSKGHDVYFLKDGRMDREAMVRLAWTNMRHPV